MNTLQSAVAGKRPSDGYFVEFWRFDVEYPEIIAWDRLFDAGNTMCCRIFIQRKQFGRV